MTTHQNATPGATSRRTDKLSVAAWSAWDAGSAAFNAVLLTFIFSVYLVDTVGKNVEGSISASQWYSFAMAAAGVFIALVTPVMGQRADQKGTRKRSVVMWTLLTIVAMALLFFVEDSSAQYFWLGVILLAVASVTIEFAEVSYFAMLNQVSTPETVGKVSGIGWAAGYVGGIVLLLVCFVGFISGDGDTRGLLNLPIENGLNIRLVALFAAAWFFLHALPLMFRIPEITGQDAGFKESFVDSYKRLFRDIKQMWHTNRNGLTFLIASAVFRDGLAGVFTFGAILAVTVFGLSASDVLIFGIAANVVAAIGAAIGGLLDDKIGPRTVIIGSLTLMILAGVGLFFVEGPTAFWILGLILCMFVGPAQSAARSFVARVAEPGKEGQIFGLYTTTGRAVSWLTPALFGLFVGLGNMGDRAGIIGIIVVLLAGLLLLLPVRDPQQGAETRAV
ncbi:MFS transporter [Corynebacterium lubricantis]|uniref:MFS transporter n=1 Tax=Corynebacterium lubricantis TaxID=541095 RepID=UPI00036865E0|nr:MFS transporter [Corynebacterium lubricantis]